MWVLLAIVLVLATGEVQGLAFPVPFESADVCEAFKASDANAVALERLKEVLAEDGRELVANECVEQ